MFDYAENFGNSGTEKIGLVTPTPGLGTSYAIEILMELLSTRKIVIAMI